MGSPLAFDVVFVDLRLQLRQSCQNQAGYPPVGVAVELFREVRRVDDETGVAAG